MRTINHQSFIVKPEHLKRNQNTINIAHRSGYCYYPPLASCLFSRSRSRRCCLVPSCPATRSIGSLVGRSVSSAPASASPASPSPSASTLDWSRSSSVIFTEWDRAIFLTFSILQRFSSFHTFACIQAVPINITFQVKCQNLHLRFSFCGTRYQYHFHLSLGNILRSHC